jgi:hypothetical protein
VEYPFVIFFHVFFGIVWAGGAIAAGLFILPAVLDAGPAGGAVMGQVVKRGLPVVLSIAAIIVLLTGVRLYMIRFTPGWMLSPEGIVLSLGALLGIAAFFMGIFVQKPLVQRLSALAQTITTSGRPPSADQARELEDMRTRLKKIAAVTAWHLLAASALMASHRLASFF